MFYVYAKMDSQLPINYHKEEKTNVRGRKFFIGKVG